MLPQYWLDELMGVAKRMIAVVLIGIRTPTYQSSSYILPSAATMFEIEGKGNSSITLYEYDICHLCSALRWFVFGVRTIRC